LLNKHSDYSVKKGPCQLYPFLCRRPGKKGEFDFLERV
jgi:hypothetical protein